MDPIKEAFTKIKDEISFLKEEITRLNKEIVILNGKNSSFNSTQNPCFSSIPTDNSTHIPTVPQEMKGSNSEKIVVSTGNEGVPTDNSTYTPTHQQTDFIGRFMVKNDRKIGLEDIQDTLDSLDNLKKELRLKFKRLTPQEMAVFSMVYGLQTQGIEEITYKLVANNLNLSESSVRDYIIKLTSKDIPIVKRRLNNKQISLSISNNLQKIASLSTLIKLRNL